MRTIKSTFAHTIRKQQALTKHSSLQSLIQLLAELVEQVIHLLSCSTLLLLQNVVIKAISSDASNGVVVGGIYAGMPFAAKFTWNVSASLINPDFKNHFAVSHGTNSLSLLFFESIIVQDDYAHYYSVALTYEDLSAGFAHSVAFFTMSGAQQGTSNVVRQAISGSYPEGGWRFARPSPTPLRTRASTPLCSPTA